MRILYDLIHARAAQDWHESINVDNYSKWANHWIGTAQKIENEFKEQGLLDTAQAMNKIVDEQRKFL